jgi:aspartyl-tRNA(Asn)/glutamyl-tRNA(Gln) amidotransferase subunit A
MNITLQTMRSEVREGKLDPKVIIEVLMERIRRYDRELRSYLELNQKAVETSSHPRRDGRRPGRLLQSLPFSIKDLVDTKGIRTTYGATIFRNHIPHRDAMVIRSIKRNGGFILGKTNTHQFALGLVTPPTRNPWDRNRIPGGSSGGSAAAVAADLALCALGTDTGGSIRIPAAMCGVTGLKPTYGRISNDGVFPTSPSMDHVGPICRYASDLPMILEGMGYGIHSMPWDGPMQVGIVSEFLFKSEKGVRSAVKRCINILSSEGLVEPNEISLPMFSETCRVTETIDTYELAKVHKKRFLRNPRLYQKTGMGLIKAGLSVKAIEVANAMQEKIRLQSKFAKLMKKYPILIYPTLPFVAPRPEDIHEFSSSDFLPLVRPLEIFNLLGYPAISIPCGFSNGMPVGVQLVSFSNSDSLIITLASEYQRITRWHKSVPEKYRGLASELGL